MIGRTNANGGIAVPNGSTVTPVDDYTVWLKCAGLKDTYGSLSAVLSSSTALATLMYDLNAIAYMIRSISTIMPAIIASTTAMTALDASSSALSATFKNDTWYAAIIASSTAVAILDNTAVTVPTMTSNTTPSGTASASSNTSDGAPYKAFDKSTSTCWFITASLSGKYIQYQFPQNIRVYKIVITNCITNTDRALVNAVTMYAGSTAIATTNLINSSASENTKLISFTAPISDTYKVTLDSLHSSSTYTGLTEVKIYGKVIS